ncbi:tetratricopeptide repeat protein [Panacibacter ginsenosidivorans]|uniref:Tetratricopeptide repeat protein n=1 Tax=Panacibacter ginsenosidivorans TaxID=1813871 RepID=A0A5B8VDT9_9BACT|nr:tetratricopeptide repeat protein [Panacibacter ginsenosidivorans]QEC69173.1 tetratricopeptide repeat protein [Panacibacter ginsenosidivorans]
MKYIFLLPLILFCNSLNAQDTSLQPIKAALCNCFEKNKSRKPLNLNKPLGDCIDKAFGDNVQIVVDKAIKKFGKDAKANFEHFALDISAEVMVETVSTCDVYYKYMDSSRFYQVSKNKDSLRKMINYRTYKMDRSLSANFYYFRAEVYFELGDYTHAIKDLDSSVITNPTDYRGLELKGNIMEVQKDYEKALRLYQKAYDIKHAVHLEDLKEYPDEYADGEELSLLIEIAVTKRKMKEQKQNP